MHDSVDYVIRALRREMLEYGEMVARLEEQTGGVGESRAIAVLPDGIRLREQQVAIREARQRRQTAQRAVARQLQIPGQTELAAMVRWLPPTYRPLVGALAQETSRLRLVVEERIGLKRCQ